MWIPGYEGASTWISWSQYNNYYGCAPLGFGTGINACFGSVPYDHWNFIPRQYMGSHYFYRHYASPQNNYFRNAVVINNFYTVRDGMFTKGPEIHEVERYASSRINEKYIDYRSLESNNTNVYNLCNNYKNTIINTNARGR